MWARRDANQTTTVTLHKATSPGTGVSTAQSLNAPLQQAAADNANSFTVAAGDAISFKVTHATAPTTAFQDLTASVEYPLA